MGRRIAIIGGGPAALAAAFDLAARNTGDDEITLYQMGWRIGGKCASGRDPVTGRVHEHGLHVFAGFYHESLRQLRMVYRRWQECGQQPFPIEQALMPVNGCMLAEPRARVIPIEVDPSNRPLDYDQSSIEAIDLVGALIETAFGQFLRRAETLPFPLRLPFAAIERRHEFLLGEAMRLLRAAIPRRTATQTAPAERLAARALALALRPLRDALSLFITLGIGDAKARDEATLAALAAVVAIGLLDDDMLPGNFDRVNDMEASAWLRRHGANRVVLESSYVRGGYDYPFAYRDGQTMPTRRWIAAGTAIRGYLNLVLTYHGSLFYHFEGAAAEILFTPYYEVLRAMGVRFAFFHRVDAIELDASGTRVERLRGVRQAIPLGDRFDHDPLIEHGGRKCWPTEPKFGLLKDGEALRAWLAEQRLTLESDGFPASCPFAEPFELAYGDVDGGFTHVILAVPPKVVAGIAAPLIAGDARWRDAVESARQIPTIAVELRGTDPLAGRITHGALLTANEQPFGTWADMSFVQEAEGGDGAAHLSYLCGAWPDHAREPGESWPDFVARELRDARALTDIWLGKNLERTLRLGLGRPDGPIPVIDSIEVRVNLNASEGYVLSPPGSIAKRLIPGQPYFETMFVAGDWTRTGIDAGCYEAAVLSGLACAAEILRAPAQP
ncbi:NAD(P)-binding protein [Sphingomonas sp. ERG5]|uniref:NAD(P)-binding protein n=1 Tax=Sphingomonas sp. ERG5 TaxID=1381597 RepID=UPI00054B4861|nr:NAD(P)-binding protein [Sphingomonas sp. ERG5]